MICPACKSEVVRFHGRSHVIPDWMYQDAYAPNHKVIEVDLEGIHAARKQTGTHGAFWCNDCERGSNLGDTYASLILTDKSLAAPQRQKITKHLVEAGVEAGQLVRAELWSGIEFKLFQSFIFSVILRGALFQRERGEEILAPKHFERIRSLYRDPLAIDDEAYPVNVIQSPPNDLHKNWIALPFQDHVEGHSRVVFRGAGFQFYVYTSSHRKPDYIEQTSLRAQGTIPIPFQEFSSTGVYRASEPSLREVYSRFPSSKFKRK